MTRVAIPLVLLLGVVALVVIVLSRRSAHGDEDRGGSGADIVPYLILALAVAVAGFALAELAATAFPGETLVFDPAENVANSLAALVVSIPFVIYFWRRQARRRVSHPSSAGWTIYLSIIEAVFMTAFIITAVMSINGLFTDEPATAWTRAVVFGGIVVLHELAARAAPPVSDAGELRRVIGAAVSLIVASFGVAGALAGLLTAVYDDLTGVVSSIDPGLHPWLAMLIVGLPIWWYRWLSPWDSEPGAPRLTWAVVASVVSLTAAITAATVILVAIATAFTVDSGSAAEHFEPTPLAVALIVVGLTAWRIHRRGLVEAGGNPLLVYQYAMAALGLATAVATAIAVTVTTFDRSLVAEVASQDIVALAVTLLVGVAVWWVFERSAAAEGGRGRSWPRSLYTLGLGVVLGLIAAGALITSLFILIRRLLDGIRDDSILTSTITLLYSGLAAWYLLSAYVRSREAVDGGARVAPFDVTIICSHPGTIATRFPEAARVRVLHRGDERGNIDDDMADRIVAAVSNHGSLVWVDEDGFRVAPMRYSS